MFDFVDLFDFFRKEFLLKTHFLMGQVESFNNLLCHSSESLYYRRERSIIARRVLYNEEPVNPARSGRKQW